MKFLNIIFAGLIFSSCATLESAHAETLEVDKDRMIEISGVIQGSGIVGQADELMELAEESTDPIYVVINSPGGSVLPGVQFISAMQVAQARGITIKCFVPMLAASMAFQIFAECDERYAFKNAALLWHPIRISGTFNALTPQTLLDIYHDLRGWEVKLVDSLKKKLNISEEVFNYHYEKETLHLASGLKDLDSSFLTLVDNVEGIKVRFQMKRNFGPFGGNLPGVHP